MARELFRHNASSSRCFSLWSGERCSGFINNGQRVPLRTFFPVALSLPLQFLAKFGQFVTEQFDEMKIFKDDYCLRQVGRYRGDIGRRHIDSHRPDLRLALFKRFQNGARLSAPLPSPTKKTAPERRSRTAMRYRCPLPMAISSMAINSRCFKSGWCD